MSTGGYAAYLRLGELLAAQQPHTYPDGDARTQSDEHFFIVVHQATELWLKQILIDLDQATTAIAPPGGDLDTGLDHLHRATDTQRLLTRHLDLLRHLDAGQFARFRSRLGAASGAQSAQFRALQRTLGLRTGDAPVYAAFTAALSAVGLTLEGLYRCRPSHAAALYRIAEALTDLSQEYWRWQLVHLQLAERMLGRDTCGTGGSSGVTYLASLLGTARGPDGAGRQSQKPFQPLWDVRAALHAPDQMCRRRVADADA